MPFLVVAIGVDNMFLMTAAFRRTDRSLPVEERIGFSLQVRTLHIYFIHPMSTTRFQCPATKNGDEEIEERFERRAGEGR